MAKGRKKDVRGDHVFMEITNQMIYKKLENIDAEVTEIKLICKKTNGKATANRYIIGVLVAIMVGIIGAIIAVSGHCGVCS